MMTAKGLACEKTYSIYVIVYTYLFKISSDVPIGFSKLKKIVGVLCRQGRFLADGCMRVNLWASKKYNTFN